MSATVTTTSALNSAERRALWAPGAAYAVAGSVAATVTAAFASTLGASLEIAGEPIPLLGFAPPTFMLAMLGVLIASIVRRSASDPRSMFVRITVALTALSFLPDLLVADIDAATRIALMLTHVAAAAVVIPGIARRIG